MERGEKATSKKRRSLGKVIRKYKRGSGGLVLVIGNANELHARSQHLFF